MPLPIIRINCHEQFVQTYLKLFGQRNRVWLKVIFNFQKKVSGSSLYFTAPADRDYALAIKKVELKDKSPVIKGLVTYWVTYYSSGA